MPVDFTTGWQRREYDRNQKRRNPWPVWQHPDTPIILAQNPHGLFNVYEPPVRLAANLTFLQARLTVKGMMPK